MRNLININSQKLVSNKQNAVSFKGTLVIPDISGFTKFVAETELNVGREITKQLLDALVGSNSLNLILSEIEGDALLFYSKSYISPKQLKKQFEIMLESFKAKIHELELYTGLKIDLSLKMIAHYGEISTYNIGDFQKLYGKTVIEAHSLLKNSIESDCYILISDNLFYALKDKYVGVSVGYGSQLCEIHDNQQLLCFTYFDYNAERMGANALF